MHFTATLICLSLGIFAFAQGRSVIRPYQEDATGKTKALLGNKNEIVRENQELADTSKLEELPAGYSYPVEKMLKAIEKLPEVLRKMLRNNPEAMNRIRRSINNEEKKRLCEVRRHNLQPRVGRQSVDSEDSRLYNIVNVADNVQLVSTETCRNPGLNQASHDLNGIKHWCKQEYVILPLLAMREGGEEIEIVRFEFPHGCACYVRD